MAVNLVVELLRVANRAGVTVSEAWRHQLSLEEEVRLKLFQAQVVRVAPFLSLGTFEEIYPYKEASHVAAVVKNPPVNARDSRDMGLTPGSGRSPGGGHGNPL